MKETRKQQIMKYIIMLCIVDFATFITNYQAWLRSYNSTMLALSYQYGFTSRSLLGTIYHFVDWIIPIDMMNYGKAVIFANVVTGIFFLFLIYFSYQCLMKCSEERIKSCEYALLVLSIMTVATYSYPYNFFRVDIFMIWVSLLAVLSLTNDKTRWLVIPLSAIGVMFHQGYVFMYFNIILVLLFYIWMSSKKKKDAIRFFASLGIGSVLFLWFELFSRTNGSEIYDTVLSEATHLSKDGIYHATLLYHEVLGIDVSGAETIFVKMNHVQIMLFFLTMVPVVIVMIRFFGALIKKSNTLFERLKYIAVAVGAATILPDILWKIDYGRWILAVVSYYVIVLIGLLALKDPLVEQEVANLEEKARKSPWLMIYFAIVVLAVPFMDVDINALVKDTQIWMQDNAILFF